MEERSRLTATWMTRRGPFDPRETFQTILRYNSQLEAHGIRMLRQLELEDMDRAATVHRVSFDDALPTLARLHTPEEDRRFFRERLFTTCDLWGYFDNQRLVGIVAFREGWIDQLYVLPASQGRGIGTALLQIAKSRFRSLNLWTFQRNRSARWFYERQGFTLVKETDGSANEEREPDALYSWQSDRSSGGMSGSGPSRPRPGAA